MKKRAYRSNEGKVIAGVCSGLGEYLQVDPLFIRIVFILFLFEPPIAVFGYIALWIAMPMKPIGLIQEADEETIPSFKDFVEEVEQTAKQTIKIKGEVKSGMIGGSLLIILGFLFLANNFLPDFDFGKFWPIILIVIGLTLLLGNNTLKQGK